ncbi:unnamed protein product [Brassica rapa]|uniref:S-adenosylmethionine-dependent methyltransferase n=1 Tax=Brassica campestris TaxID=3711 RepID=A0A8D9CXR9_BRACM|nr:unnamed protein product [Brassica rapa]
MSTSSQSYPMSGGEDLHSYIHNSSYQKAAIDSLQEKTRLYILEKIDLLSLKTGLSTFTIADFGCSVGPNTFHAFLVCFNDQPNNDFNTLFRTQPPSSEREYFSVGVPGSFYGRVLPRNSIHVGHTSYTIHWLSKVPEHVCEKKSPAWNKKYIQCNNLIEEAAKAYKIQFTKDMSTFLEARAAEIVPGGLMILQGQCLPDGVLMSETWEGIVIDTIGDCLMDMEKSELISEEKLESFSVPIYFPQFSELKGEIEQNGSFAIELMQTISHPFQDMHLTNDFTTSTFRAIFSSVIEKHFGEDVVDELFDQLTKKLNKYPIDFQKCKKQMVYCIVLKRNT